MKRLVKSFLYAYRGVSRAWHEEQNLKLQSLITGGVVILGFYFRLTSLEWLAIIFACFLVLLMELINSAVERVTDVLKPRINGYVKEIKDIMAGAVMLASIMAIIVGLIVFLPYFF